MSIGLDIPAAHHRCVWVFSYVPNLDPSDSSFDPAEMSPEEIAQNLGLESLARDAFEIVDLADLRDYGLVRYLEEANGLDVPPQDRAALTAMSGYAVLIFSNRLDTQATALAPRDTLAFVARFETPMSLPEMTSVTSASAQGQLPQGKPPKSKAAMSGMIATFVLVFLALFVTVFVWIGG